MEKSNGIELFKFSIEKVLRKYGKWYLKMCVGEPWLIFDGKKKTNPVNASATLQTTTVFFLYNGRLSFSRNITRNDAKPENFPNKCNIAPVFWRNSCPRNTLWVLAPASPVQCSTLSLTRNWICFRTSHGRSINGSTPSRSACTTIMKW